MLEAREQILIIGWDFDPRIILDRDNDRDETLGAFLLDLAQRKPDLKIDILKWDVGALKMLFRGRAMIWLARWAMTKAIRFKFDHAHPPACSHHQKVVVIDDSFAICGGIDMTSERWDTRAHRDDEPGRVRPDGSTYGAWHDVTTALDGGAARALADLGRDRWKRATGETLKPCTPHDLWPEGVEPDFTSADFAIARTRAEYRGAPEVREIEALYLDLIAAARRFIYAENQYFASPKIAAAIAARMAEPDPPEIVLINPIHADGWLEQKAMDAARVRLCQVIGESDPQNRFRIYTPVTTGGAPIYVHAKVMIVDDVVLRVGSSNLNNRSLGLDSECDVALDARSDAVRSATITRLRTSLMAEHLGTDEDAVAVSFAQTGSLLATIEALRGPGKTLERLVFEKPDDIETFIADNELLDPESPDKMFELANDKSLFRNFRSSFTRRLRRR